MGPTTSDEASLPFPVRWLLYTFKRLVARTHTFEDGLVAAGVRVTSSGTADMAQVSDPLEPGRYLVTFVGVDAEDVCYVRQRAETSEEAATNAAAPFWHKDRRYLRVTGKTDNVIAVLFASSGAALNIVRSLERCEE